MTAKRIERIVSSASTYRPEYLRQIIDFDKLAALISKEHADKEGRSQAGAQDH